jgi:hypothetical protein
MIIEVNGQQVEVDDSFATLSPEKQQETLQYITGAISPQSSVEVRGATEADLIDPLYGTIGGAFAGQAIGPAVNKGVEAMRSGAPGAAAAPGAASGAAPGQKFAAKTGYGSGTGYTVEEVVEHKKAQEKPIGKGKITSKIPSNSPMNVDRMLQLEAAKKAEDARRAAALAPTGLMAKMPEPVQAAGRFLGGAAQSGLTPYLGRAVAGGGAGYQGFDAYNRLQQGDYPGAAISGLGALGSAAAFVPTPLTRIGGSAVGIGAEMLNMYLDSLKKKVEGVGAPAAAPLSQPAPQGMAEGGDVKLPGKAGKIANLGQKVAKKFNYDPYKMSQQYPDVVPPVLAIDAKTGKEFLQKQLSPEALEVQKARKAAQKQIDAGNYQPFFDVEKRFYADPSYYPTAGYTATDIVPKKADTIAKYEALANDPESLARLRDAFEKAKDRPAAKDWYAMGQLEEAFIKELGPVEGRKQFKARFADAMAATTGGADPNSNLMMAAFTNYQKGLGQEIPTAAADLPFPISGRFVAGNMEQAKKLAEMGEIPVTNPKRHNFSANFLGHRDVSTLDEQMSQLWDPKMKSPPPNAYGIYQQALAREAQKAGVQPANFQDIAWAGAKDYPGKPMMQEINEMIERTHSITGEPKEEILKGFIRGNKPMYGVGAVGGLGALGEENQ